jgi:hypothetical protein
MAVYFTHTHTDFVASFWRLAHLVTHDAIAMILTEGAYVSGLILQLALYISVFFVICVAALLNYLLCLLFARKCSITKLISAPFQACLSKFVMKSRVLGAAVLHRSLQKKSLHLVACSPQRFPLGERS